MKKQLKPNDIKQEMNEIVNALGLTQRDLIITFGAAATIHGLREHTEDIDVYVRNAEAWARVTTGGRYKGMLKDQGAFPECLYCKIGNVVFHYCAYRFDKLDVSVRGFGAAVVMPVELLRNRVDLGRKKDLEDIMLLRDTYQRSLTASQSRSLNQLILKHG